MAKPLLPRTDFAARLIEVRGNTSRRAFAAELGVPLTTLAGWEQGVRFPPPDILLSLRQRGVSIDWLLTGTPSPGPVEAAFDEELLGQVIKGVLDTLGELPPRDLGQLAARMYRDILSACAGDSTPAARTAALRMALTLLRRRQEA